MKRAMLLLVAVGLLAGLTGCIKQYGRRPWACLGGSCAQAPEDAQSCDGCSTACGASCEASCDASCESTYEPTREEPAPKYHACRLRCRRTLEEQEAAPAPPSTGAITYPYYTTRGPRDFLAKNPPSIGP